MYNVLIIDDDMAVLYMLRRFKKWEEYGFSIEGDACDGKEAFRKLKEKQYDLIITDIKMPGMDGIEFLQELRNMGKDTCVIFLSTHSDFEYAKKGIRFGVFEYMTKPVEEGALTDILTRAKIHIDQKHEQTANAGLSTIQPEKDSGPYYQGNLENLIVTNILNGNSQLENIALHVFNEICGMQSGNTEKIRMLANTLLFGVRSKIDEAFPRLNKIEGTAPCPAILAQNIKTVQSEFINYIQELQDKIQKYELNHTDSTIRRICEFIIDNIGNEISLETISNEVHISKDYVGKLFKQKVMYNFNYYVTKVKMEHAKYLILTGDYKNYEICEMLGYKKTDYFASLFKEYTGFTPMEYKKLAQ